MLADTSTVTVTNTTLINSTLDDFYYFSAANTLTVNNLYVDGIKSTGSIKTTSSLLKISRSNAMIKIKNFTVLNSNFIYGKAMEIETAKSLDFRDSQF